MNDVADPLAHNGLGRVLLEWAALSHDEPADWVALVKARYFACLFGSPIMWGVLFKFETETRMQNETQNLEIADNESIARADAEIVAARATLDRLKTDADDTDAEAQRWQTTFEHEPTGEARLNAAVFRQKATNAKAASQKFDRDVLQPLVAERKRREQSAVAELLRRQADELRSKLLLAAAAFSEGAGLLDKAVAALEVLHAKRVEASKIGVQLEPLSLAALIRELDGEINHLRGSSQELPGKFAQLAFVEEGRSAYISLQLNRPAAVPALVR